MINYRKITTLFSIIALSLLIQTPALSQTQNNKNQEEPSLYYKLRGLNETPAQSRFRSADRGASLQVTQYPQELFESLKLNEQNFADEINAFVTNTGRYFTRNRELKGIFKAQIMLFTSYKKPFAYTEEFAKENNIPIEALIQMNKNIVNNNKCNSEGFCFTMLLADFDYFDEDFKDEFDKQDYIKFLSQFNTSQISHYSGLKKTNEPLLFTMYLGTNGKLITEEEIKIISGE